VTPKTGVWTPVGYFSSFSYATEAMAWTAARQHVAWLDDLLGESADRSSR
jgi:hypothetical protein